MTAKEANQTNRLDALDDPAPRGNPLPSSTDQPQPTTHARSHFLSRLASAGGALLRHVCRSPTALLSDVERYVSRARHQPETWNTDRAGRIVVADRLQDVWPLNVEVRPGLRPRLNVLLPSLRLEDLTGGPNTALNLTSRLASHDVPIRYIATDRELNAPASTLREHLNSLSGLEIPAESVEFLSGRNRAQPLVFGEGDVCCVTAWWTAQMIREIQPRLRSARFLYLIQDFEPAMYEWSTRQALALETYSLDFQGLFCGHLLADYFQAKQIGRFAEPRFADRCATFEPAVDPQLFAPRFDQKQTGKKRLLFYARPHAPRNLFEMGLVALRQAVDRGAFRHDEWEIGFIGDRLPAADLGSGVVTKSYPWRDYRSYARLLQSADVGLSLMLSPHTSYPPLEMAACGATVVTNTYSVKTAERLRQLSENLLPVEPRLDAIVAGLLAAEQRTSDLPERFAGSHLSVPRDWNETFEPVLPQLLQMWRDCRGV